MIAARDVDAALATVRDPELDEPVTELGFVKRVAIGADSVEVELRLPTFFCAPNFAWIMVADAERALARVPGVAGARVTLGDHFATDELRTTTTFQDAFPGEADAELDDLRRLFARKAFLARQHAVVEALGRVPATIADVPPDDPYLARRAELGLDMRPDAPFLVTAAGAPVADPDRHLKLRAVDPREHRGQRRALPRPARDPLRRGGGGVKAARLHAYHDSKLALDDLDEPSTTRPVRRRRQDRRRRPLPHRHPHHRGPVGREVGRDAALHARPRERRLGARGRLGRQPRRARRHGDRPPARHVRRLPRPAARATTCTARPARSRASTATAASRTSSRPTRARVVKLDPELHPKDIAALADAGLTAYHAVKKATALLHPGTRALVIGAGGLGHIGIQCLKAMTPAEVIVADPSEPALALARELGADQTVTVGQGHVDTVKEMTDGLGADVVVDFVGEKGATKDGVAMLRDGGSYYVIGYGENLDVPTIDIISREINFVGNLVGTYLDLAELMTLTAQGKVTLETRTYPLEGINDALADLDGGRLQGRGILIPEAA